MQSTVELSWRPALTALALTAGACAVYAAAVGIGFFSDDYQWLGRMNPTLERPSFVFTVFFRDFNPVLHASFALDWLLAGRSAALWHAHSILIHALATVLLFALCSRLGSSRWAALTATALWATNVRLSEAVIWPAARGHQLATVCALGALVLLRGKLRGGRWLALGLIAVGLFAKETTLFAMAAIPFFLEDWKRERALLAGWIGLAAGFVTLNFWIKAELHTSDAGPAALLLKAPFILLRPLGLGDFYRFDALSLLLVAVAFAAVAWALRRGVGLAGLVWVLACSAPLFALDKLSSRYLYLPAVGYSVVLVALWSAWVPRLRDARVRRLAGAVLAVLAGAVVLANVLRIQREIEDYALLAEPYDRLCDQVDPALSAIPAGQRMLVVDGAPHATIPELTRTIRERGNITKLIPYRQHAIDGLIELPDLLNVCRPRLPGTLGRASTDADDASSRWLYYDGSTLTRVEPRPVATLPTERIHRARWDRAEAYFDRTR